MANKPFSIRFSDKLSNIINLFAERSEKSASEFVRDAVEERVSMSGFRSSVLTLAADGANTFAQIRDKLCLPIPGRLHREEMAVLMYFWHWTYLKSRSAHATPRYVIELLDITSEISALVDDAFDNYSWHHALGCLRSHSRADRSRQMSVRESIDEVKVYFPDNPSVFWAEMVLRPLETMADLICDLPLGELEKIFAAKRVRPLLPAAVAGAKAVRDDWFVDPDEAGLTRVAHREINGLSLSTYWNWLRLVISGDHHTNVFGAKVVSGLATGIENDAFSKLSESGFLEFRREGMEVLRAGKFWTLHDHGGYRLQVSDAEFDVVIELVKQSMENDLWRQALAQYRMAHGDV